LDKILQIIASYDLVAVQEVRDLIVMDRIKAKLGDGWSMSVSDQIGTESHKERYAILWRNDVLVLRGSPALIVDMSNSFAREPYMAYFVADQFDFILATIHVVWGDSIVGRRNEIKKLDTVLQKIQERAHPEKDIILVGDFNMPPSDVSWEVDGWEPLIRAPRKTVVGDSSLYDNIWLRTEDTLNSEYKGDCGVLEFDKIMFGDTAEQRRAAINEVSDHRPVWGLFATDIDDDPYADVDLSNLEI